MDKLLSESRKRRNPARESKETRWAEEVLQNSFPDVEVEVIPVSKTDVEIVKMLQKLDGP